MLAFGLIAVLISSCNTTKPPTLGWLHGSADGQGLDVDIACKNTLVQYNYVHHNKGGGILLCNIKTGDHSGTVIRNNIFYKNDGSYRGSLMTVSSNVGATDIYNNTIVLDNGTTPVIIFTDDWLMPESLMIFLTGTIFLCQ